MAKIQLTKNKVTVVDDSDYEVLSRYKWHYTKGYAARNEWRGLRRVYVGMHRFITNAPDGMEVDHINGDRLDNRRVNLRVCTPSQNQHNRGTPINNTSGFKGVSWHKATNKWCARIKLRGKEYSLGYYDTAEAAAKAYDKAAREMHGAFARLNKGG